MATLIADERDYDKDESRISELPDDILMSIVSPLGMKEAAKTSILSKQWRYLGAKLTHLDFNHLIVLPDCNPDVTYIGLIPLDKKTKYINWVNQVVDLHRSPCIDTFRVCSAFLRSDAHHIDKWVRFALSRKVKNLELNLMSLEIVYTLTFDILKPSLGVGDSGINFLQSLYLNRINVSGDILEYLLAQCRFLERLHIEASSTLVRWKVFGSSCNLKQLTISCCHNLEELEIDAVNLLYLRYCTANRFTNVVLKNMPMLVELMFGGHYFPEFIPIIRQHSHLTAQISKLTLRLLHLVIPIRVLPTFCKLEHLTLIVTGEVKFGHAFITEFLKACPMLHAFTLEIKWRTNVLSMEAFALRILDLPKDDIKAVKYNWDYFERVWKMEVERINHPNLREFKVIGFNGCTADVEVVLFLILCTSNLETITCDSSRREFKPLKEVIEASRSRAAKLVKLIPPKIRLVIL